MLTNWRKVNPKTHPVCVEARALHEQGMLAYIEETGRKMTVRPLRYEDLELYECFYIFKNDMSEHSGPVGPVTDLDPSVLYGFVVRAKEQEFFLLYIHESKKVPLKEYFVQVGTAVAAITTAVYGATATHVFSQRKALQQDPQAVRAKLVVEDRQACEQSVASRIQEDYLKAYEQDMGLLAEGGDALGVPGLTQEAFTARLAECQQDPATLFDNHARAVSDAYDQSAYEFGVALSLTLVFGALAYRLRRGRRNKQDIEAFVADGNRDMLVNAYESLKCDAG